MGLTSERDKAININHTSSEISFPTFKQHIFIIFLITFTSTCLYLNSLSGEFIWDDIVLIENNPYIKDWDTLLDKGLVTDFFSPTPEIGSGYYRPVITLSYAINYSQGRLKPDIYHLTNLLFHTLCGIVIYLYVWSLLKKKLVSLIVALLFAAHPIHTESVAWISGRTDVVCAIFFFLSLYFYHIWAQGKSKTVYSLSMLCFVLSLLSKEMACTLPLVIVFYDYYFLVNQNRKYLFKRIKYWCLFWGILLFYSVVRSSSFQTTSEGLYLSILKNTELIITFLKAFGYYLYKLVLPYNLNAYIIMKVSSSPLELPVMIALVVLICLAIIVFKSKKREINFGILFFLVTLIPLSNIVALETPPDMPFPIAERFLYIPSFGFCFLLGILIDHILFLGKKNQAYKVMGGLTLVLLLLFYSIITINRNKDWCNGFTLFSKTLETSPDAVTLHANLGTIYLDQKKYDLAISQFKDTLRLEPRHLFARYNLGIAYLIKGDYAKATEQFSYAVSNNPKDAKSHSALGIAYSKQGLYDKAIDQFTRSLILNPDDAETHNKIGYVYIEKRNYKKAVAHLTTAVKLNPEYGQAYVHLTLAYYKQGLYDKAMAQHLKALRLHLHYGKTNPKQ